MMDKDKPVFVTNDSSVHRKGQLDATDEAIPREVESGGGMVIENVAQAIALAERPAAALEGCIDLRGRYMTREQAEHIGKLRVDEGYSWRTVARACHERRWWPADEYWDRVPSAHLASMVLCAVAAEFSGEGYQAEPWN